MDKIIRTDKQRKDQIARLKKCKEFVPPYNFFNESNLDCIDAEIYTLEQCLSEDEVRDTYEHPADDYDDPDQNYREEQAQRVTDSALDAIRWLFEKAAPEPALDWERMNKNADDYSKKLLHGGKDTKVKKTKVKRKKSKV